MFASHSRVVLTRTVSKTGCRLVGEPLMTRRISLVAVCCSVASARSRSHDSSLSVTRFSSFLSWLSSVARGLFFFFETPSRAMWVPPDYFLGGLQGLTLRRRLKKMYPGLRA